MRPVMHGDVVAAARVLFGSDADQRVDRLARLIIQSECADRYRLDTGFVHPFWGDGSLMAASLACRPPPEPGLNNSDFCTCMGLVFDTLVSRRRSRRRSGQSDPAPAV